MVVLPIQPKPRGVVLMPETLREALDRKFEQATLYGKNAFISFHGKEYDFYFHIHQGPYQRVEPFHGMPVFNSPVHVIENWRLSREHPEIDTYASKIVRHHVGPEGAYTGKGINFYNVRRIPEGLATTVIDDVLIADDTLCREAFKASAEQPSWDTIKGWMSEWRKEINATLRTAQHSPYTPQSSDAPS